MSWTIRQLVDAAYTEIGLSNAVFSLEPEQYQEAARRLEAMVAGWESNGIRLGMAIPPAPDGIDLTADSKAPSFALEAIYTNLAIKLAPTVGKTVSAETTKAADQAYSNMASQCAQPIQEVQFPGNMPRGAGSKYWRWKISPLMDKPQDPVTVGGDGEML